MTAVPCIATRAVCAQGTKAASVSVTKAGGPTAPDAAFFARHCNDCHTGESAEGGLDLTTLSTDLGNPKVSRHWVRIVDRIAADEMPPKDAPRLSSQEKDRFLASASTWLKERQKQVQAEQGRVRGRRLTNRELERSLQAVVGVDIPVNHLLSEETGIAEFATIAESQAMSHFQLEKHLEAVDLVLDEAYRRAFSDDDVYQKRLLPDDLGYREGKRGFRTFEVYGQRVLGWMTNMAFYGRIDATAAPADGWYKFKMRTCAIRPPEGKGVWITVRSGLLHSGAPLIDWIAAFETEEKPKDVEFEAWLPKGHRLEIRPNDITLKRARFASGGNNTYGEGEAQKAIGMAIYWLQMERIHKGPDNAGLRKLLFGDAKVTYPAAKAGGAKKPSTTVTRGSAAKAPSTPLAEKAEVIGDPEKILVQFASRAFRRPVTSEEIRSYLALVQKSQQEGNDLASALRVGFRAILCSPRFLYLYEPPGQLDDYALASRLSYMLTGAPPDEQLLQRAEAGLLQSPLFIKKEADRLLTGDGLKRFVKDFADEWLDLDQIEFTEPDRNLVPDFDPIVQNSMLEETRMYVETMLKSNLPVSVLVDSNFTFLNSRLAAYYGIPNVKGETMRRIVFKPNSPRGGILTHGSILKVTANGTNTSPVIRGVWINERILGEAVPPPPSNVPAIEPDIRGAKTIREQLALHRDHDQCASCHVKIDPPGFALENFDPGGKWRDNYVKLEGRKRVAGPRVDPSYSFPDGRSFRNFEEFRVMVAGQPQQLAHNFAEKLMVYGTGAPVSFADREEIEGIVTRARQERYGVRTILDEVITSPLFRSK
ncbi:DUF1592 domain-containing protein [Planctomicrobium sp. SH664]|uniref:DUF1592 domain-containing protein n=1 Tax=Planctomicrobium sp. SH664 TaxID=3448125 RepID=UPI003F5C7D10